MTKILAITGGVGGAKLALGLSKVLEPNELMFAVNTGDDFEHLGLHISPDIDSLTYALAEENNPDTGWGRRGETWHFIDSLEALGGEAWFRLGDKDLALHMLRTQHLKSGASLTEATRIIADALGLAHTIAPMSDDPVRTVVHTDQGSLPFQHYFVREQCAPKVTGFEFDGIGSAVVNPKISGWLAGCDGVVICPSNPYVSVDPVLALPGFSELLAGIPIVAVSPIVGGLAIKGPAAKMMQELNVPASATAVAVHYADLIDGFVLDATDAAEASTIEIPTLVTNTIMKSLGDRMGLARTTLDFLYRLR
jgi:LPPG:FO 2-phospho-L-lactate transferase